MPALAARGRHTLQRAVKAASAAIDAVTPAPQGVAVLIYHRVGGGSGLDVDLDPAVFDDQMATVAGQGGALTIDEAAAMLVDPAPQPGGPPPVVVTFDDGTVDFVDEVLPVIVRHRVPVTLYVATAHLEHGLPFPGDGPPMSWAGLAEAVSTGLVTVGSHTHGHRLLDRLAPAAIDDELDRSIELIGDRVGVQAAHFAYPKAVPPSPAADRAVRHRFRTAALAGTRLNAFGRTDLHRLARSPIQASDGARYFRRKLAGGMRTEDALRQIANRRRYARATT